MLTLDPYTPTGRYLRTQEIQVEKEVQARFEAHPTVDEFTFKVNWKTGAEDLTVKRGHPVIAFDGYVKYLTKKEESE